MGLLTGLDALPTDNVTTYAWWDPGAFTTTSTSDTEEFARMLGSISVHVKHSTDAQLAAAAALASANGYTLVACSSRGGTDSYDPNFRPNMHNDLDTHYAEIQRIKALGYDTVAYILDWEHMVVTASNLANTQELFRVARNLILGEWPGIPVEHYGFGWDYANTVTGYSKFPWYDESYFTAVAATHSCSLYYGPNFSRNKNVLAHNAAQFLGSTTAWMSLGTYRPIKSDGWGHDTAGRVAENDVPAYDIGASHILGYWYGNNQRGTTEDKISRFGYGSRIDKVIFWPSPAESQIALEHFVVFADAATP